MTDPLNLEPPDGDYVRYIESLQKRGTGSLKPLEPEDFMGGTQMPEKSGPSLKSLLKTLHIPGTSGEDESRRKALARMEEASRGDSQSPAALPNKKAKVDPALRFVSTAFAMFGLIGIVAGADSGDEAPIIFGVFAILISAFLQLNGRFGTTSRTTGTGRPRGDRR